MLFQNNALLVRERGGQSQNLARWHHPLPRIYITAHLWHHKGLIYNNRCFISYPVKSKNSNKSEEWTFVSSGKFITLDISGNLPSSPPPAHLLWACEPLKSIQYKSQGRSSPLLLPLSERKIKALLSLSWVGLIREKYEGLCVASSCTVRILKRTRLILEGPLSVSQSTECPDWPQQPNEEKNSLIRKSIPPLKKSLKTSGCKNWSQPPFFPDSADLRPLWAMEEIRLLGLLHGDPLLPHWGGSEGL